MKTDLNMTAKQVNSEKKEKFHLDIFDYSTIAYSVLELVLNQQGEPVDWIYRYCNQAFADIKGYNRETMLNQSFLGLYPEMDKEILQACYQAAYENVPRELDVEIKERYHLAIMPTGQKGFCSVTVYKNPETKKTGKEDASPTQGYILRKLFPDYVSLYSVELNSGQYEILRLNDNTNAKRIVESDTYQKTTFDDYIRQYANTFILEEDREEFLDWHFCEKMKKRLCKEDSSTFHYRSVTKDGKDRYFEGYVVRGKVTDKEFQVFLGYRNIDSILYKEKAIQDKLKKALEETKLQNEIISSIAKTYQYLSRIDIQADWFEEISNREKEDWDYATSGFLTNNNKKMCKQYIADVYQEAFFRFTDLSTLPDRMEHEETIAMEYQMKNGDWHKIRFIEKKRDENGRLTHVLCAIRRISDEKKREQELLYQVVEAKADIAMKSKFLSDMSHDIRTPMNGIMGMIDFANRYPNDLQIQQRCRDKIKEASKSLVTIVNNVLDMNKLESKDAVQQEIEFDLTDVLNRANTAKQTDAAEKHIDYVVRWENSNLIHTNLIGNPFYLERLLTVIGDNAVKFTKSGGCIQVWCTEKPGEHETPVFDFICADNGVGMSGDFLEHAFDVFSQEKETSRSSYEGTGLGLAIAKKLSEKLNGKISIKSQKGIGTTVIATIPFKLGKKKTVEKTVYNKDVSLEGLRVLLAEDNDLNMEIAKFMLEENGLVVECAKDGLEAVHKFEASKPGYYNFIIMDIMMPNMNGYDATRKIRSMQRTDAETIPIVAMSANAFAEDMINSRISGMNEHIMKPLEADKFVAVLKSVINLG